MKYLRYALGAVIWHIRAGFWYLMLGLRLYFAAGLDQDFDPAKDDVGRHFICPIPRAYRAHLGYPVETPRSVTPPDAVP